MNTITRLFSKLANHDFQRWRICRLSEMIILSAIFIGFGFHSAYAQSESINPVVMDSTENRAINSAITAPSPKEKQGDSQSDCIKLPMQQDGIVRLSKIEVYPEYLDEYIRYAVEVGEISLRTEPGVLTMYAMAEKDAPNRITILETYVSQAAYRSHIQSAHFQKYKKGTLHMVKNLILSDQTPLNPNSRITNVIQPLPCDKFELRR